MYYEVLVFCCYILFVLFLFAGAIAVQSNWPESAQFEVGSDQYGQGAGNFSEGIFQSVLKGRGA